ncbi:MAG: C4-dicarboxylate ABC transporter [Myxococcales bacterium]|nr:C4-dicarboxylate ABC transporter [Myxococcales bacterium]
MAYIGVIAFILLGGPLFIGITLYALVSFPGSGLHPDNIVIGIRQLTHGAHGEAVAAILLFTVAGFLLAQSKAPQRIVRLAEAILGWMHGGLAIVTIMTLAFFTTFTGASGITIIALGGLLLPLLLSRGYPKDFSLGVITASGSIGLLFFPSLPVFYCSTIFLVNENTAVTPEKLFLAALIPGMLMVGLITIYAFWVGRKYKVERTPFTFSEVVSAFRGAIFEATLPVWLLYAVLSGNFGFNDIALLTAAYLFVVEVFIYRDIHPVRELPKIVFEAAAVAGAIVMILIAVNASNQVMTQDQVPDKLVGWLRENVHSQILLLVGLNILLLIVGCLMDIFSALACVLPLLVPMSMGADPLIDPLHLAVIFLANLELGYITPPVGMNLFISGLHFRRPILQVAKSVLPFLFIMLISVLTITYVRPLSTWLPNAVISENKSDAEKAEEAKLEAAEQIEDVEIEEMYQPGVKITEGVSLKGFKILAQDLDTGETDCALVLMTKVADAEVEHYLQVLEGDDPPATFKETFDPALPPEAVEAFTKARAAITTQTVQVPGSDLLDYCTEEAPDPEEESEE